MNVLIISQTFEIVGGSDVIARLSARVMEEAGHTAHFFAALDPDDKDDGIHPYADHFFAPKSQNVWRFMYSPQARARLEAFLDANPVDVAHLHIHYGTLTSSILRPLKKRGIRIVQHLHEYRTYCSISVPVRDGETCQSCRVGSYLSGLKHKCNRGSLARSVISTAEMYVADRLGAKTAPDLFLTVSDFQRDILIEQGMPADRIKTLYNPVHHDFFTVEPKHDGGVLFIGRLEDYKGIYDIIKVAAKLENVPFRIVGTGNHEAQLRSLIAERGLTNIELTGNQTREQVLAHLAWAKVGLVPSRWNETFGLTAAEAMAAGVPVIVSRMGGLPEVVEDGVSGFVVEMGDVDAMVVLIDRLMTDREEFARVSKQARNRALEAFSETKFTQKLAEELVFSGTNAK
ncbi:glycosyltransferase family 4 protein [Celeribacter halophilus]|uniref:Glycosyltransferase family 4 protein n=1 Tax=Celeribacter halophilus TaxID=576117 RepID=A0AAW7XW30_9RHOB|nr:glycosyltransferase family 4 protein [Celeribacter halophilus]MDO6458432.1 glycosyltransferase family 4 protein [Celeribacter halophilus]